MIKKPSWWGTEYDIALSFLNIGIFILIYFKTAMWEVKKQTNKQMDRREQRCWKKDIISVECFFWWASGRLLGLCVCVHHEFTNLHIILPLFTRAFTRGVTVVHHCSKCCGGGGGWGQSPLSLPVPCWPYTHYSVRRKARIDKNTLLTMNQAPGRHMAP